MTTQKSPEEVWTLQKTKLKLLYTHLNDEDLAFDYGKKEVMMTTLQAKLGKTREELNVILLELGSAKPHDSIT